MFKSIVVVLTLLFVGNIDANLVLEEALDLQDKGVMDVCDDRVYLSSSRLFQNINRCWVFQNDLNRLVPIGRLQMDQNGFYVQARIKCPNGHEGFIKEGGVWYCNNYNCAYYWQKMEE